LNEFSHIEPVEDPDWTQLLLFQVENGVITATRVELLWLPRDGDLGVDDSSW
jgi:hypothetical protein